jgi:hypothetical protein
MSTRTYAEEQFVEQPTIKLFAGLGWQTVRATEELFASACRIYLSVRRASGVPDAWRATWGMSD